MKNRLRIICTVTNDLNYDQRMIRICTTLAEAGHQVTLVGFRRRNSKPLKDRPFKQIRLPIIAEKGKLMYADYWLKLFFWLLFQKSDVMCAIDLDTIMPVYYASIIRSKDRVYDAHELFTELKEVIDRPSVHRMWLWIANHTVPNFPVGYTIGEAYAEELGRRYGVRYGIVRNATILRPFVIPVKQDRYVLYQGAVNVGRCFEELIPAMKEVDAPLVVCGEGNFFNQAVALTCRHNLLNRITFKGYIDPESLRTLTAQAWVGITLFEATSLSNRLSLANRFFDYMHHGVPQICIRYPEYARINAHFEVCVLIDENPTPQQIADAINLLLQDQALYDRLQQNCLLAREVYCWQKETETLLSTYARFY